jgi:hypothetical protein
MSAPQPPSWVLDIRRQVRRRRMTAILVGCVAVSLGVIRVSSGLNNAFFAVGVGVMGVSVGLWVWMNIWWGALGARKALSGENYLVYDLSDMDRPRLVILSLSGRRFCLTASPWDEGPYTDGLIECCEVYYSSGARDAYVLLKFTMGDNSTSELRLRGKPLLASAMSAFSYRGEL